MDAYLPLDAFSRLQEQLNRLDADDEPGDASEERESVMLRGYRRAMAVSTELSAGPPSCWLPWICSTTRTTLSGALVGTC